MPGLGQEKRSSAIRSTYTGTCGGQCATRPHRSQHRTVGEVPCLISYDASVTTLQVQILQLTYSATNRLVINILRIIELVCYDPGMQSTCLQCQNSFSHGHSSTGKYCSGSCQQEWKYENVTVPMILRGETSQRPTLKRYMIRKHGHQCMMCKSTEWMGEPIPLELDHIEGDASKNKPEDIRILCPNCHAMTPTWKNRNKGKGRASKGLPLN